MHGVRARSRTVLRTRIAGVAGAALVAPVLAWLPAAPAAAETTTFSTPGTYTYTVPLGTSSIAFTVSGSQGGRNGGNGGTVTGSLAVSPGDTFLVDVGGYGTGYYPGGDTQNCGGQCDGGGASDIRGVAIGGGGGASGSQHNPSVSYTGGIGGYPAGTAGTGPQAGGGGTQTAPGAGGGAASSGSGGTGGTSAWGSTGSTDYYGGGGGGGYFGGGGGANGAGGGGSSWASGAVSLPQFCNGCRSGTGEVTITTVGSLPGQGVGYPSRDCAGGTTWTEGFVDGTYVRVQTVQPDNLTTWVCVRTDGTGLSNGGKFVVTSPAGSAGLPTADSDADACTTAPGNTAPGPHPLLSGHLGDPSDPATYLPFLLDSYVSPAATWVCVGVGTVRQRVIVRASADVVPPTVTFVPDAPGSDVGTTLPPSTASGACQANGGSRYLDLTSNGVRTFAYTWKPTASVTKVCVRTVGVLTAGGVLTVDTSSLTQALPSVTTSTTDLTPCTVGVAHLDNPMVVDLRRSATGSIPASVCVTVGTTRLRVTVGAGTGLPSTGSVTWTPDS